jgi:hypothetical protein
MLNIVTVELTQRRVRRRTLLLAFVTLGVRCQRDNQSWTWTSWKWVARASSASDRVLLVFVALNRRVMLLQEIFVIELCRLVTLWCRQYQDYAEISCQ